MLHLLKAITDGAMIGTGFCLKLATIDSRKSRLGLSTVSACFWLTNAVKGEAIFKDFKVLVGCLVLCLCYGVELVFRTGVGAMEGFTYCLTRERNMQTK